MLTICAYASGFYVTNHIDAYSMLFRAYRTFASRIMFKAVRFKILSVRG
ncbi:hypothetical protein VPHK404_0020 [Vibrio phage K404]